MLGGNERKGNKEDETDGMGEGIFLEKRDGAGQIREGEEEGTIGF